MRSTGITATLVLALVAPLALAPRPALAQDPPPESPTDGAVPRGQGGAVLQPPDQKPQPKRDLSTATPPRPLNDPQPIYPPEALKAGLEAKVIVKLEVDRDGHLTKTSVVEPVGHGFDEAALEAASRLQLSPAHWPDGTPFPASIKYRFTFHLDPKKPAPEEAKAAEQKKLSVLSGVVLVKGAEAPVAGALVSLAPAGKEGLTDEKGAFTFPDLPPGKYTLLVRAPGLAPFSAEETLAAGEATDVKYRLTPSTGALEVVVEGDRPPREVTKRTLDVSEIERIPGTNGDALKSLQSLPGVARPPGFIGLLIVRGSAPQDTQTFIDGTPVPIIYHFGGLSSVVPTEVLQKIDFYPGNFGTAYGRAQGGIVDVGLRNPKPEYHGLAQFDFIDGRLLLEGPIPGLDGWTFLAAGRRSYVGSLLGPVLSGLGAAVTEVPTYYDYQFMIAKKPTPRSSFRVSFIGSDDAFGLLNEKPSPGQPTLTGNFGLHTAFQRLQMRYANDLANGDKLNVVLGFGVDEIALGAGAINFNLDFRSISGRAEYSHKLTQKIRLDAGLDMNGGYYDVQAELPPPIIPGSPPNGPFSSQPLSNISLKGGAIQPAAYVEMEITPNARSRFVPGVRVDYFNITRQFDVSPRANARYEIRNEFPKTTLKAGLGFYHQQPQFQEVTAPFGNPNLQSNRSTQFSLGAEQQITQQIEASVEGFYKALDNQVVGAASSTGASFTYTNAGTGYVGGAEVLIKYKPKAGDPFFGWIAYTLSRSVRTDGPGQSEHLFQYDQPHILTILGSYNFKNGWEFGARFRLISGLLVTPNACDPSSSACVANRTNALFNAATGTYVAIPLSGPFSERLPIFNQLDLRVDHHWQFKRWKFSAYLDIQNAYNQSNVDGYSYNFNYTARTYVADLPILPSFGLRGEF